MRDLLLLDQNTGQSFANRFEQIESSGKSTVRSVGFLPAIQPRQRAGDQVLEATENGPANSAHA
jgi:hypothetical protein